tara:strand:+ start:1813 stop:1974 length:162 start_codon:yes stop_codon:yes gene_type:complete
MESKRCPKCKKQVPLSQYSKNQYRAGAYCKPCMSEYSKNRSKIRQQRKQEGWF